MAGTDSATQSMVIGTSSTHIESSAHRSEAENAAVSPAECSLTSSGRIVVWIGWAMMP